MIGIAEKLLWILFSSYGISWLLAFCLLGFAQSAPWLALDATVVPIEDFAPAEDFTSGLVIPSDVGAPPQTGDAAAVRRVSSEQQFRTLNGAIVERLTSQADAWREAQKADGERVPAGWRISNFRQGSVLGRLGFLENDVIESIDGVASVDMGPQEGWQLFEQLRMKLESHEPVGVTVKRHGLRFELFFRLSDSD